MMLVQISVKAELSLGRPEARQAVSSCPGTRKGGWQMLAAVLGFLFL